MNVFDYANASFIKSAEGRWALDRDWAKYPPTQIEIEVLFAHCLQLDQLLAPLLRHLVLGNIQTAEGLGNSTFEEVMHWIAAVRSIMGPPRVLPTDTMQTASLGPAE